MKTKGDSFLLSWRKNQKLLLLSLISIVLISVATLAIFQLKPAQIETRFEKAVESWLVSTEDNKDEFKTSSEILPSFLEKLAQETRPPQIVEKLTLLQRALGIGRRKSLLTWTHDIYNSVKGLLIHENEAVRLQTVYLLDTLMGPSRFYLKTANVPDLPMIKKNFLETLKQIDFAQIRKQASQDLTKLMEDSSSQVIVMTNQALVKYLRYSRNEKIVERGKPEKGLIEFEDGYEPFILREKDYSSLDEEKEKINPKYVEEMTKRDMEKDRVFQDQYLKGVKFQPVAIEEDIECSIFKDVELTELKDYYGFPAAVGSWLSYVANRDFGSEKKDLKDYSIAGLFACKESSFSFAERESLVKHINKMKNGATHTPLDFCENHVTSGLAALGCGIGSKNEFDERRKTQKIIQKLKKIGPQNVKFSNDLIKTLTAFSSLYMDSLLFFNASAFGVGHWTQVNEGYRREQNKQEEYKFVINLVRLKVIEDPKKYFDLQNQLLNKKYKELMKKLNDKDNQHPIKICQRVWIKYRDSASNWAARARAEWQYKKDKKKIPENIKTDSKFLKFVKAVLTKRQIGVLDEWMLEVDIDD